MNEADEKAFLQFLERYRYEVYPRRVPPDWVTFRAKASEHERLPPDDLYLCASDIGPAEVDVVKRGRDKGFWRIDEVKSPVIFWQRSLMNDDGELLSGQLWAELEITAQTGRRDAAPDRFRVMFIEMESWLRKSFRQGNPKPFLVGNATARAVKEGQLKLRDAKHRGELVTVHK